MTDAFKEWFFSNALNHEDSKYWELHKLFEGQLLLITRGFFTDRCGHENPRWSSVYQDILNLSEEAFLNE